MLTRNECISKYGAIVNGAWADQGKNCIVIGVPEEFHDIVVNSITHEPWKRIYCNKDMAKPITRALWNVVHRGLIKELKTYDGCFCIRDTRGNPGRLSAHSWAMAVDLNAMLNPLGGESQWTPEFVRCFTEEGFAWGGAFERTDPQHFSFAGF